ncbi:MAG: hypothetical protein U5K43_02720 [Halofilum sp. (in: g-proteobacteria)]|nr:hypothetical protein [Halofilum sp. (in: g-proteobacteria)]
MIYFTAAVVGEEHSSRGDFTASEDDNVLVQGIANNRNALGFFGLAYYLENQQRLKAVPISYKGSDPVMPSKKTAGNGEYQPLTRPLFIYVKKSAYENKDSVQTFVDDFMLNPEVNRPLVDEVGYVPLAAEGASRSRRERPTTARRARPSPAVPQIGVSIEDLLQGAALQLTRTPRCSPGAGVAGPGSCRRAAARRH